MYHQVFQATTYTQPFDHQAVMYVRNEIHSTETLKTLWCEVRQWSHMAKILGLTPGWFQY